MKRMDPYLLLGIREHASDAEVTDAYHAALRSYPPEREPEMFTCISEAYEAIRTEEDRVRRRLFPPHVPVAQLPEYFSVVQQDAVPVRVKRDVWLREARRYWARRQLV
jgi:hypothetical protein